MMMRIEWIIYDEWIWNENEWNEEWRRWWMIGSIWWYHPLCFSFFDDAIWPHTTTTTPPHGVYTVPNVTNLHSLSFLTRIWFHFFWWIRSYSPNIMALDVSISFLLSLCCPRNKKKKERNLCRCDPRTRLDDESVLLCILLMQCIPHLFRDERRDEVCFHFDCY